MKRRKRWQILPIVCSVLLLPAVGVTGIIAYQTAFGEVQNQISPGFNDSEIEEEFPVPDPIIPGEATARVKKVAVKNVAGVPCFVRIMLKISSSDLPIVFTYDGKTGYNTDDWVLESDGYYYYKKPLNVNESTTYVVDGIQTKAEEQSEQQNQADVVSVYVYAETVQAKNAHTGMEWKDYREAWQYYGNRIVCSSTKQAEEGRALWGERL